VSLQLVEVDIVEAGLIKEEGVREVRIFESSGFNIEARGETLKMKSLVLRRIVLLSPAAFASAHFAASFSRRLSTSFKFWRSLRMTELKRLM